MILGMGVDLVEVERVRAAVLRQGDRFLQRVFTESESGYCGAQADPGPHWAARWAAKEAVAKAFGTGMGASLGWQDVEVVRDAQGAPQVRLTGRALALLSERGGQRMHVSLSHTAAHAMAVAILEG
jgi:holo-[acyl-carrier protein] synthase